MCYSHFDKNEFMGSAANALPAFPLENVHATEEPSFRKIVDVVDTRSLEGRNGNIIGSHRIHRTNVLHDVSLKMKCRIAPHGNEDNEKDFLTRDSASCTPLAFFMFLSVCSLLSLSITKVDFKAAFLQTGAAERPIYDLPPRKCATRWTAWLLNVAT